MSATFKHTLIVSTESELPNSVAQLITMCDHIPIWCFTGEMGVGKTTLIKALCKHVGVNDEMSSPTFSIVNEYRTTTNKKIYHFDLYRLKKEDELFGIGFEEYIESGNFCFIEWPEIAENVLQGMARVNISMSAENETRKITIALC